MTRYSSPLLLLLLLATAAPGSYAEIYRWVDEDGRVHFEDRSKQQRDRGVKSYSVPAPPGSTPEQRMEKTRKLLNAYATERQQAREQQEKQKQREEKRKRKCVVARDKLRRYQGNGGVYRLDKDGERVYLSDQERDALIQRSRNKITKYCD
jgi:hypothetical protein